MSDGQPTTPLPDLDASASGGQPVRRRRWPRVVLAIVVVLVVLAVIAELIARAVVPGVVRTSVIEQLDLPADQQLEVEVTGLVLPQLIAGRLDELHLSSDQITIGGVTGSVDATATGVPVGGGDFDSAAGTIRIDQAQLTELLAASDLPIEKVTLQEPDVVLSGTLEVLTLQVPVGLTVTPGVEDGDLLFTVVSVSLGDGTIDLNQVTDWLEGTNAELSGPHRICIADRLPAGITLTDLQVDGDEAVIDIDVDGRIATDEKLLENGSC